MKTLEQIDYLRKQLGIRDSQVLNDLLNSYSNAQISLQNQLVKQQQIIDKAIEYLKDNACYENTISELFCDDLDTDSCMELLNILRGSDEKSNE